MNYRTIMSMTAAAALLFGATASGFAQMRGQQERALGSQQEDTNTSFAPRGQVFEDEAFDTDRGAVQFNRAPNNIRGGFDRAVNGSDASTPGRN